MNRRMLKSKIHRATVTDANLVLGRLSPRGLLGGGMALDAGLAREAIRPLAERLGFTIEPDGSAWTMQEPFGAFTWYPVNDQPADKALYDVTVHAPAPWTGISNGHLTALDTADGTTTSAWQLTEPASSYLVTLAVGDYTHRSNKIGRAHV